MSKEKMIYEILINRVGASFLESEIVNCMQSRGVLVLGSTVSRALRRLAKKNMAVGFVHECSKSRVKRWFGILPSDPEKESKPITEQLVIEGCEK
jgi:hypothetical protein